MSPSVAYLLDTNVVSEMMRPNPEPRVAACIDGIAERGVGLASITVWEILDGIGRLDPGRRRKELLERFRAVLDEVFEGRVLAWTGTHRRAPLSWKRNADGASHSTTTCRTPCWPAPPVRRGLTLVTRNTSEFRHAGLHVVNPWTAPA